MSLKMSFLGSKFVVSVIAAALMSGAATNFFSSSAGPVAFDVMETAAITQSASTVGISDSDIFFMSTADINKTLDAMQSLGVNTVRLQIPWAAVEPAKGRYDWSQVDAVVNAAASRNMAILGVLTTTPTWAAVPGSTFPSGAPQNPAQFGRFAGLAASRYAGKVSAYEVWNEPNSAMFYSPTPSAAGYVALLKAAYPAIKAADPSAVVVAGAVASIPTDYGAAGTSAVNYVSQLYAAGAQGYFDALSYHPYKYGLALSSGLAVPNSPANQLIAIHQLMLQYGDGSKQIWASEYGDPVSVDGEAMQAALLTDFLNTWSTVPYAGPAFIYTTRDSQTGSTDPEATFGLFRTDWSAKPSAYAVQAFIAGTRTGVYGAGPVYALASLYNQWTATYGADAANNATLALYYQAINNNGQVVADVYFNAFKLVIGAQQAAAAAAPTVAATPTAKVATVQAVSATTPVMAGVTTATVATPAASTPVAPAVAQTGGVVTAQVTTVADSGAVAPVAVVVPPVASPPAVVNTAVDVPKPVVTTPVVDVPKPVVSTPVVDVPKVVTPVVTAPKPAISTVDSPTPVAVNTPATPATPGSSASSEKPAKVSDSDKSAADKHKWSERLGKLKAAFNAPAATVTPKTAERASVTVGVASTGSTGAASPAATSGDNGASEG